MHINHRILLFDRSKICSITRLPVSPHFAARRKSMGVLLTSSCDMQFIILTYHSVARRQAVCTNFNAAYSHM